MTIEELFEKNQKLVPHVFYKHFRNFMRLQEDLLQSGYLGLWKACQTFESGKSEFSTYAVTCIKNEMLNLIRSERKHKALVDIDEETLWSMAGDEDVEVLDLPHVKFTAREQKYVDMVLDGASKGDIKKTFCVSNETMSRIRKRLAVKLKEML